MADEDALRKIRAVEEQIEYLQKKLAVAKQVGTPPLSTLSGSLQGNSLLVQAGFSPTAVCYNFYPLSLVRSLSAILLILFCEFEWQILL